MSRRRGNGHDEAPVQETQLPEGGDDRQEAAADSAVSEAPSGQGAPEAVPEPGSEGLQELPPSRQELEALRRERDQLGDELLRRRAEFENYRKRSERDQQAAVAEATAAVLRRLLDTVDNLERALATESGSAEALRHGVELTLRDLRATLEAQGVSVIDPQGLRFDPLHHQALLHEPVPGVDEGIVAEVLRKGYLYRERLLRPALVKVASGEGEPDPVDSGGGGEVQ